LLPKNATKRCDLNSEIGFLDRQTRPRSLHQGILRNRDPRTLEQRPQYGDRSAPYRHRVGASEEDLGREIKAEAAKCVDGIHGEPTSTLRHFATFLEMLHDISR